MNLVIPGNLLTWTPDETQTREAVQAFLQSEPGWVGNAARRDPALVGKSEAELMLYQGLHSIAFHRLAHAAYDQAQALKVTDRDGAARLLWQARAISQGARRLTTGLEIHPGAKVGADFFIDHGTGTVIGETAEIGDRVHLYHNVTLGAASGKVAEVNGYGIARRHPKLGNDITVSTGTKILGPVTVEDDVKIGANVLIKGAITIGTGAVINDGVIVTHDVPPGVRVVGSAPVLPGILTREESGAPIMIAANDNKEAKPTIIGKGLEYFGKGIAELLEHVQQLGGVGRSG